VRVGGGLFPILFPVILGALLWGGLCLRDGRLRSLSRKVVEILARGRENAAQTGTMGQTES